MRIRNLKIALIAPALLLIPMGCMHFGDGHHTGYNSCYYYSEPPQKSLQSSPTSLGIGGMFGAWADNNSPRHYGFGRSGLNISANRPT
jgi:hypothetical protein